MMRAAATAPAAPRAGTTPPGQFAGGVGVLPARAPGGEGSYIPALPKKKSEKNSAHGAAGVSAMAHCGKGGGSGC